MAKKPNFLDNIWSKGKDLIVKGVTIAGNAGGALLGVPTLGTMAGNILEKIPVKKMAEKALSSGKVDSKEVEKTLIKNDIPPTKANVKAATDAVKVTSDALADDPTNGLPNKKAPVDPKALSFKDKIMTYVKQYWYVVVIVIGGVVYLVFKPKSSKKRR